MTTRAAGAALLLAASACGPLTRSQWLAKQDRDIAEASEAIAAAPDDDARARALSARGRAYSEKARYARVFKLIATDAYERLFASAIADHDRAVALAPGDALVFLGRGLTYYDRASLEDPAGSTAEAHFGAARADFTSALGRDGACVQALDMRGVVHAIRGEHDAAIDDFTRLAKLDPHRGRARLSEAYCQRATAHHRERRLDAAIADYEAAMRLGTARDGCSCEPEDPLVTLYTEKRRYDRAWDVVRRARATRRRVAPEVVAELERASGRR